MTRRTKLLVGCAGLAALVAAVPWLVPLAQFIPRIEATASARLGVPVTIGSLRLGLLPLPHVSAQDVTIDETSAGHVGTISVWPVLGELLSDVKVMREVRLEDVELSQALAARLLALPRSDGPPSVLIERVVIARAALRLPAVTLRDLDAQAELDADGRVEQVTIERGRTLRLTLRPGTGSDWTMVVKAHNWTPPLGPGVVFDRIDATATLRSGLIETRDLTARLYGGRMSGTLRVGWKPDWSINGELTVEDMRLQPAAGLVANLRSISGRVSGKPRFSMGAKRAGDLAASLQLASEFVIHDGTLGKVDLVAAARNPLAKPPSDGETRFDELSGMVEIDQQGYHFYELNVASGLLRATGEVTVSRDRQLDGRVSAELRGTASLLSVPLAVSGTAADPVVRPTKTALAAAIAGSVLLPGIGTALGIKAGDLTDRLLGKRREPAPAKVPAPQPPMGGR